MGLFSFIHREKQSSDPDDGGFYSRAEEESAAVRGRGKRRSAAAKESGAKPVDPVLPEKKRARRRLVGAVALVLALIIGLPMVLDSEPKPVADDIVIQIPSKEVPENRARIRRPVPSSSISPNGLDPAEEVIEMPPSLKPSSLSASAAQAPTSVVAAATDKSTPKILPKPTSAIDRVSLTSPAKEEPVPVAARPEQKAEGGKPALPKPSVKENDARRAVSTLEGQTSAKPDAAMDMEEKKGGKVMLQVAALASQQKVGELQSKLASVGIQSHTQKIETKSGERIRVRVGPYASNQEADKVRAKLSSLGLNGRVVPN